MSTASPPAFFIADGDRFIATSHGRGPWSAHHLHAGPPAALLARAIERATADDPALMVTRLTLELMAPVHEGLVGVTTSVLRAGRSTRRLEAALSAGGKVAVRALGVAMRQEPLELPPVALDPHAPLPPPEKGRPFRFPVFAEGDGYPASVDARLVRGGYGVNPTAVWIRSRMALVAGEDLTPLQRVMIAADSGNGVAVVLDPTRYTFVNADLTVHLHRLPVDEWVCLEAVTAPEPNGIGLSTSRLFDRVGPIGVGVQGLLLARR
jgi:hypothetical protein